MMTNDDERGGGEEEGKKCQGFDDVICDPLRRNISMKFH